MTHNWKRTLFEMEQLLSNKAQISMHDTQLDENLDLEKMVGPEIQNLIPSFLLWADSQMKGQMK